MILYTFAPVDTSTCYLLPFQHLRMTFARNITVWKYKRGTQHSIAHSDQWDSECMFVPAPILIDAIKSQFSYTLSKASG